MTSISAQRFSNAASIRNRIAAPLAAGLLGILFIFGVGFINISAIHDAAHDVRHMLSFPCH